MVYQESKKAIKQENNPMNEFQTSLKKKMDEYVNFVYDVTKRFPKEEQYGSSSQWRRATLSIILNWIEGYARRKQLVQLNFLEISYGSLKESRYLLYFSRQRGYITENDYYKGLKLIEEIGAMLWTEIKNLESKIKR